MDTVNALPDIYHEGLAESLEETCGGWGLCCSLDDEFVHELGRSLYRTVTVYARGVGRRTVRLLDVQGDVLRGLDVVKGHMLFIPLCALYMFHEEPALPLETEPGARIRLDGGGSCRGCRGMVPELERIIGTRVGMMLPEGAICLKILRVSGLTLFGISGEAPVLLRVDCIDALELPLPPDAHTDPQ